MNSVGPNCGALFSPGRILKLWFQSCMKIVPSHVLTQVNRAGPSLQTSAYHWVLYLPSCFKSWWFYLKMVHVDINLDFLSGPLTFENATNTQMTHVFTDLKVKKVSTSLRIHQTSVNFCEMCSGGG